MNNIITEIINKKRLHFLQYLLMDIIDKNVFLLVLRDCWPQDFLSLALSCKKIRDIMRERQFWLHFRRRFWPSECAFVDTQTDEELIKDTISMWRETSYIYFILRTTNFPIELARSIAEVQSNWDSEYLKIEMRAKCPSLDYSTFSAYTPIQKQATGRADLKSALRLTRIARRLLSDVFEGGDVTAFGDDIYIHNAILLKSLLSLQKKKIVYKVGTRICLMIFRRGKLDSCRVPYDGFKAVTLLIDKRLTLGDPK